MVLWRGTSPVRNPVMRKMKGKHRDMMTDYGAKRWLQGPPDKYSNSPPALGPGLLLKLRTQLSTQAMDCGLSFHLLDRYLGSLPASPKDHNSFRSLFGVCSPQCSALQNLRGPAQAHLEKSARENGVQSQKCPPSLLSHGKVTKFPPSLTVTSARPAQVPEAVTEGRLEKARVGRRFRSRLLGVIKEAPPLTC